MRRRNSGDALETIARFQKEILRQDLSIEAMYEEIRMMRFKVRPLSGDVMTLNLRNRGFIQALWNLGKLDEFFQRYHHTLKPKEREIFFDIFDNLHERFEGELNRLNMVENVREEKAMASDGVEMEIFKEYPTKKKLN